MFYYIEDSDLFMHKKSSICLQIYLFNIRDDSTVLGLCLLTIDWDVWKLVVHSVGWLRQLKQCHVNIKWWEEEEKKEEKERCVQSRGATALLACYCDNQTR